MVNAIYFYTTDCWEDIPVLMEEKGIKRKLTFTHKPMSENNFSSLLLKTIFVEIVLG